MRTPRSWPDNAEPTPQEFADWIAVCTPDERLHVAESALRHASRSSNCFVTDHEGELDFLRAEMRRLGADLAKCEEAP